jgi:MFS family permease
MKIPKNRFIYILILLAAAIILRFGVFVFLGEDYNSWLRLGAVILILGVGAGFVLQGTAKVIEETTDILSKRTKLASGFLQSLATAFPDMALGIVAAIISLRLKDTNYSLAISFAIIAAATTFGSNIYNVGHAGWCIFRQNLANRKNQPLLMFPFIKKGGTVKPMAEHLEKPSLEELDNAMDVFNILTILTAVVAITMVLFGQIKNPPPNINGDLYQLIRPVGLVILILCALTMYHFRKAKKESFAVQDSLEENYQSQSNLVIFVNLLFSGMAILLAAETMVNAIEVFCNITGMPFIVAGVLAGIIGCLGEMMVIHNFTINPAGRIGDAVVGVGMDNIITTLGASIVAVMGGIFLGGNALILIFVVILTLNSVLIWQVSKLKNYLLTTRTN